MKIIMVGIESAKGKYEFVAKAHKFGPASGFNLDPEKFYLEFGGAIPDGEHFELEVIEPGEGFLNFHDRKLRIVSSANQRQSFVWYPYTIPSIEHATVVFRDWCLGTVTSIEKGIDFEDAFSQKRDGDDLSICQTIGERYGIKVYHEIVVEEAA